MRVLDGATDQIKSASTTDRGPSDDVAFFQIHRRQGKSQLKVFFEGFLIGSCLDV